MKPKAPLSFVATLLPAKFVAIALNDHGEVVGKFDDGAGEVATYWRHGRLTKLRGVVDSGHAPYHIKGRQDGLSWSDSATSITNNGIICGRAGWLMDGDFECWPIIWKDKKPSVLPRLSWPLDHFEVQGINLRGEAVGWASASSRMGGHEWLGKNENNPEAVAANCWKALYWHKGKLSDFGWGKLQAINDAGDIVGRLGKNATLWRNRKPLKITEGIANAISPHGIIVGDQRKSRDLQVAFRWKEGKLDRLTPLSGYTNSNASGVNDKDWIVGSCFRHTDKLPYRATLWIGAKPYDLNRLVTLTSNHLTEAVAINALGQILCHGDNGSALLTPRC